MVRIRRCQRCGPGSIPGWRIPFILITAICVSNTYSNSFARLAQTVERLTLNQVVVGSIPTVGAYLLSISFIVLKPDRVAQLDSALDFESNGCGFESRHGYYISYYFNPKSIVTIFY